MSVIFLCLLYLIVTGERSLGGRVDDVCSTPNLKAVFLGLGESGVLTAVNVTPGDSANVSLPDSCRVDVVSCPSCVISLTFRFMNLSCYCGTGVNLFLQNPCRCDHVWISEPAYNDSSGKSFSSVFPSTGSHKGTLGYKSKTRAVRIWLFYSKAHNHAFTLDYKSERWGSSTGTDKTPNYYLPTVDEYSVAKMVSTVFLLSFVGLIFLILSFAVILYLFQSSTQNQRNLQRELQSVANFQDSFSEEVSVVEVVIDDPPSYEPPPNYDEVVKMEVKKSAEKVKKSGCCSSSVKFIPDEECVKEEVEEDKMAVKWMG